MFNLFSTSKKGQILADPHDKKTVKKEKKKTNANRRVPHDVYETIPYKSIYPNGIIEDYNGGFSKSYRIEDANFVTESEEKKIQIFSNYENVINSITPGMVGQLMIFNRSINIEDVRNNVLMKPKDDGNNDLREEWNNFLLGRMQQGRNNLKKEKIFTISSNDSDNIVSATDAFKSIDESIGNVFYQLSKKECKPMPIEDRLSLLYDIYNPNVGISFDKRISHVTTPNGKLDFTALGKAGIPTKDLIGPDGIDFYPTYFRSGQSYCAAFYVDHLPNSLNTQFLDTVSNLSCNLIASVTYVPMAQDMAVKLIQNRQTAVNAQIATLQRQNGGLAYIPSELENASDKTKELLADVQSRDQKIFKTTFLVMLMCDSYEDLQQYTATLRSIVSINGCMLRQLYRQQELALNTCLPLAQMQVALDRVLTTEAASSFMPYSVQELYQPGGDFYGVNAVSKNMLRYNRSSGDNFNSIVVGKSGSGKSFTSKMILMQRYLNSNDKIIVIDPQGEYTTLGEELGATIIKLDTSKSVSINPLDLDMHYDGDGNPLSMKTDYMLSLVEVMVGEGMLDAIDKSIIQRVTRAIYRPYIQYMQTRMDEGITIDRNAMPTLQDFYEMLTKQPEPQAQRLATSIENYCTGVYDMFAHRTTADTENRLIIYNVQNLPSGIKELAMQVCMNDAWLRIIANGSKGIYTDFYIDEFHRFTRTKSSAAFMCRIYKQCRRFFGSPCAITQNIGDFLVNEEAAAIVNNSNLVIMMNQSPMDRAALADMYSISEELQEYITDKGHGIGLIYNGRTTVPFISRWDDQNTRSFKMMNSFMDKSKSADKDKKKQQSA